MRAIVVIISMFLTSLSWAGAMQVDIPYYVPQQASEVKMSFAPVVKKASPAVVNIYSKGVVRTRQASIFDADPFFHDFFGNRGYGSLQRERVQSTLGSGVIVQADGIIVTNNHVIQDMTEIKAVLTDRREYPATVLLADPKTDLAVLKIETDESLPFLSFANSDEAAVGDIVLAIGNPFGVGQTVTNGIVSALARSHVGVSDFQSFIQTDAAINPGNSGGALVDVHGRLMGINTAIYSRSGGSNGIGFAIPSNLVKQVVNSALAGEGELKRPWLGASMDSVDSNLSIALGLDRPTGVIINQIFPNSPVAKAGLQEGDIITGFEKFDIYDEEALKFRVATRQNNDRIKIKYLRNGKERQANVTLALPPENPARNETILNNQSPLSGLTIANMSPALNDEIGRSIFDKGVVILNDKTRYASRYGFRNHYRIVEINGERINNVEDVKRLTDQPLRSWRIKTESPQGQISSLRIN